MEIITAIAEDNIPFSRVLESYLQRYGTEHQLTFRITKFRNGAEFIASSMELFDLVFMDVEMPFVNGMDAAAALRKTNTLAILIFITNLAQYAIKGYEVDAADYILKPVQYSHFAIKLKKALRSLPKRDDWYALTTTQGIIRISCSQIRYVESQGHVAIFHVGETVYTSRTPLKTVEAVLHPYGFTRINNSFLLNLKYIQMVQNNTVIAADTEFTLGRSRKQQFMDDYAAFIRGRILC